jgi:hypothetical protein
MSEVRVLCSPGITRLHRYYDPLRGPSQPPSHDGVGMPAGSGLPLLTQITFSACRAHYPGGSVRCFSVISWRAPAPGSSRTALAFPHTTGGRHPRYSFRGLLELHWYYGLQICSPTFRGLGCEASMESVTKLHRSSAIQAYRDLLVRDFHPLVIGAARAHDVLQKWYEVVTSAILYLSVVKQPSSRGLR